MNLNYTENEKDRFRKKAHRESQWNLATDMVEEKDDTRINYKASWTQMSGHPVIVLSIVTPEEEADV